jgi:c-di-GMP-binding flagellar brake protein YcgR
METKDYFIRGQKQIVYHLNEMIKHKCMVTVSIDDQEHFLSALFEIDSKAQQLKFDGSRNADINRKLLSATKVLFRTEVKGIKASFKGKGIKALPGDKSVFIMSLPESIYWLQRRDCYRVRVPHYHLTFLQLLLKSAGKNYAFDTFNKKYKLADISADGFSFMNIDKDIQWHFESNLEKLVGKEIKGTLILDEDNLQDDILFEIKNVEVMKNGPAGHYRVGCKFTEISPLFMTSLQYYIRRIEIEEKEKSEAFL